MRKITANYIFPVSSAPLKNGIIVLDDTNRIVDIIDTKNKFKEIENLEFYGGTIVPGFVDAFTLLSYNNFTAKDFNECATGDFNAKLKSKVNSLPTDLPSLQRGINHLEAFGTKAAADLFPHQDSQSKKEKSKVHFVTPHENLIYQLAGNEAAHTNSITLINHLVMDLCAMKISNNHQFCIGTGSLGTHQKLSIFEEMKLIQQKFPKLSVWEIIKWASLNPAQNLKIENDFGSLEIGKKPGLNLISGIDFTNNQLTSQAELKILI
ncbi:amidohydrolase family protein [Marinifilum sp. D737]|uniref:amidohydrolase family protein n=1 Tax=Marinifilum sp. D737 TaxID=2969628 RepID=UPI00227487E0|nr:amidohydrolase family protein [Marinifilum sp. D737]MCY1634463.1 amidohydrolase family protein [Marinifilum sp. D737]